MRRTRLNSSAQTVTFRIPTTLNFTDMDSVDLISAFAGSTVFDRQIDVEGVRLTAKDGAIVVTIPDYVMDWHHNNADYVQQVEDAVKQWLASAGTVKDNTRFANRMLHDSVNSSRLPVKTQRTIRHCINSARRRAGLNCGVTRYAGDEEYTELRRASLKSARRLNSGKLFYDDATGEYEEYEYDNEQDAWYQLPDEMYIYKLDLSQFADLVRDGIVSKHEIHEWIDGLSEDWGGIPAWSPAKPIDRFEIQDLTKEQYDTWKANFAVESVRFCDELERRY